MTIEQIKNVMQAKPFKPFNIHVADGSVLHVAHQEFLSHTPGGRTLIVYGRGEDFNIVDLLLVTKLEVPAPKHSGQDAA